MVAVRRLLRRQFFEADSKKLSGMKAAEKVALFRMVGGVRAEQLATDAQVRATDAAHSSRARAARPVPTVAAEAAEAEAEAVAL